MKVNTKSYPHPVLGNGNDLGGIFSVEFTYELGRDTVVLKPIFTLSNMAIDELLRKNKASFTVEVQCPSTFFRKSYICSTSDGEIVIPAKMLREQVTAGFYICATQDIKGYKPSDPHPDYENAVFDIESGDVVAVGGKASFIAEKSFDPLRPPVSSFMSIMEGSQHEGPMEIDYEADKITIVLSKADWKTYLEVRGQKPIQGILHSAIVLPTLVDAVHKLQTSGAEYEHTNWFGRLNAILEAKRLQDKDPFEAAQRMLDNPVARSFRGMERLINSNDDEGYEQ